MSSDVRPKVLLAEDDPQGIDLVARALRDGLDYDLIAVPDGEAVLDQFASGLPDLVLLDVMLPKLNGIEVCQAIKHEEAWRDVPVCIVTTSDDPQTIQASLRAGADDFLAKPFR